MRGWVTAAILFGLFAIGSVVTTFTQHHYVGGPLAAVVFGAIAARCWVLGGE